jgi:micrococcal nuclease
MNDLLVIEPNLQVTPEVQSLVEQIQLEIESGFERTRLTMEHEKRQTYWNVGKYIKEHLLSNSNRAGYGDYLFPVLAENLSIDRTTIYRCVHFYEDYPQIVATSQQLTWSHITALLPIEDKKLRQKYEERIIEDKLTVTDLRELIKSDKGLPKRLRGKATLSVFRGEPWVYRLQEILGKIVVDLGFNFAIESPLQNITPDSVMKVQKENSEYKFNSTDIGVVAHYTYKAYLLEVIDGDTLWVNIDLGFNSWTKQKLRLRGINASELSSSSGKSAKEYIEARLKGCGFIVVKTYWRDKYTRYLADVFYDKKETDYETLIQNGKFLNQELLDKHYAVKY